MCVCLSVCWKRDRRISCTQVCTVHHLCTCPSNFVTFSRLTIKLLCGEDNTLFYAWFKRNFNVAYCFFSWRMSWRAMVLRPYKSHLFVCCFFCYSNVKMAVWNSARVINLVDLRSNGPNENCYVIILCVIQLKYQ